ncbi:MAG: SDR family NAD(P)-dependent oxidoreductase [Microthrixaceae bacterium]
MSEREQGQVADLNGLRVLVTGGAQGVGERIAGDVTASGGSVAIGDVQVERATEVAGRLGDDASAHELDVTDADSWSSYVEQATLAMGGVDALVNNAAILHLGPLAAMEPGHIDSLLRVNLLGPTLGIRAVAPMLADTGGGSIVNISSVAGLEGRNATVAYTASKWGVRGLTKAAAVEYGQSGVRINAVCPSMGNPDMFAPFLEDFDIERFMSGTPQPKLHIDGEAVETDMTDVSAMVCWLLSPAARRCTGADFVVDAGWTAGTFAPGMPGF